MAENIVILKNVCKSFHGREILKNINLFIEKGKIYGFIGQNGVGKSTLLNILEGKLKPNYGDYQNENKSNDSFWDKA